MWPSRLLLWPLRHKKGIREVHSSHPLLTLGHIYTSSRLNTLILPRNDRDTYTSCYAIWRLHTYPGRARPLTPRPGGRAGAGRAAAAAAHPLKTRSTPPSYTIGSSARRMHSISLKCASYVLYLRCARLGCRVYLPCPYPAQQLLRGAVRGARCCLMAPRPRPPGPAPGNKPVRMSANRYRLGCSRIT